MRQLLNSYSSQPPACGNGLTDTAPEGPHAKKLKTFAPENHPGSNSAAAAAAVSGGSGRGGGYFSDLRALAGPSSSSRRVAAGAAARAADGADSASLIAFNPEVCEWYFVKSKNDTAERDQAGKSSRAQQKGQQQKGKWAPGKSNSGKQQDALAAQQQQQQHYVQGPALPPEQAFRVLTDDEVQQLFPGLCNGSDYSRLPPWILHQMEMLTDGEVDAAIAEAQERIRGEFRGQGGAVAAGSEEESSEAEEGGSEQEEDGSEALLDGPQKVGSK